MLSVIILSSFHTFEISTSSNFTIPERVASNIHDQISFQPFPLHFIYPSRLFFHELFSASGLPRNCTLRLTLPNIYYQVSLEKMTHSLVSSFTIALQDPFQDLRVANYTSPCRIKHLLSHVLSGTSAVVVQLPARCYGTWQKSKHKQQCSGHLDDHLFMGTKKP